MISSSNDEPAVYAFIKTISFEGRRQIFITWIWTQDQDFEILIILASSDNSYAKTRFFTKVTKCLKQQVVTILTQRK